MISYLPSKEVASSSFVTMSIAYEVPQIYLYKYDRNLHKKSSFCRKTKAFPITYPLFIATLKKRPPSRRTRCSQTKRHNPPKKVLKIRMPFEPGTDPDRKVPSELLQVSVKSR
jgi:hypothetical protein